MAKPMRILFVCLGNICRSPLAEVVVKSRAEALNLNDFFTFASAGTGNWHLGGCADPRSAGTAAQHGLSLKQHRAQQITKKNMHNWDCFIAMDADNRRNLIAMGIKPSHILMMRQFESDADSVLDVPDPYYGGADGFEDAYQMLCENADKLLLHLRKIRK